MKRFAFIITVLIAAVISVPGQIILSPILNPPKVGYQHQVTWTIPAPSATESNFTVLLRFSNANFKTGGGGIQHTVTFDNLTVPADLIVSTTPCASPTIASHWGWSQYNGGTGTGLLAYLIPTYSGATTLYGCGSNKAVSTYQGGTRGSEYDSNTIAAWHLSDNQANGTIYDAGPNGYSFSLSSGNTSAISGTGPFGANTAILFNTITASLANQPALSFVNNQAFTAELWISPNAFGSSQTFGAFFDSTGVEGGGAGGWTLRYGNNGVTAGGLQWCNNAFIGYNCNSVQTLTLSTWQYAAFTFSYVSGNTYTANYYANNGTPNSFTAFHVTSTANSTEQMGWNAVNGPVNAYVAELHLSSINRTSNWITDVQANQSSVPLATNSF